MGFNRIFCVVLVAILFTACKGKEQETNPNLPPLIFKFTVTPNNKLIDVGDTIVFDCSMVGRLSNGQIIDNGDFTVGAGSIYKDSLLYYDVNQSGGTSLRNTHFSIIENFGKTIMHSNGVVVSKYTTLISQDTIKFRYSYIFKKRGLYCFFLNGASASTNLGKTYTDGFFDTPDNHWDFVNNGLANPLPGSDSYRRNYWVGVR